MPRPAVACAGTAAVIGLAAGLLVVAPPASADPGRTPTVCLTAERSLTGHDVDTSNFDDSGIVTIDGWSVDVHADQWHAANRRNPTLTTAFHSASWLIPPTNADLSSAVAAMLRQSQESPDPGGESDTKTQMRTGWKEGHVTRRLGTALCLYEWTTSADDRLALTPVIEQLAAAASDPLRYYGPPRVRAHNHGLMSDLALDRAGRMLHRPDWIETAKARVHLQLQETFDSCGMVFEQASAYQHLHASLWRRIARFMSGDAAVEARVAARLARQRVDRLRDIDGSLPIIGDVGPAQAFGPVAGWTPQPSTLWCPETGWYATTSLAGSLRQHLIARFGPRPMMHGHEDHGSVTWTVGDDTDTMPVLVDRGLYDKERGTGRFTFARSVAAHSTLQAADLQGSTMTGFLGSHGVLLATHAGRGSWHRVVALSPTSSQLAVTDTMTGDPARRYQTQRFQLDPRWHQDGARLVAKGGWRLRIQCSANGTHIDPAYSVVEHFPGGHVAQTALAVDCQAPKHEGTNVLHAVLTVTRH